MPSDFYIIGYHLWHDADPNDTIGTPVGMARDSSMCQFPPPRRGKVDASAGSVSNVDIDGNNTMQIKVLGAPISTFETLPTRVRLGGSHSVRGAEPRASGLALLAGSPVRLSVAQ